MQIKTNKNVYIRHVLALFVISYVFLMAGNNILSLTDPDEVFYAQTAKEMLKESSWMTPYLFGQPQFEKPILTYWLLRLSFEIFGVSSFSARFFPAFVGILGVLGAYIFTFSVFKDSRRAWWAAIFTMSNGLYFGLSRTVFTDLIFTVFIFFSLAAFFFGYSHTGKKRAGILLFFIFSGIAVLTKGPLGFLIPFFIALSFLVIKKDYRFLFCRDTLLGFLLLCAISVPWYALMISKYGASFTHEFFYNDHFRRLFEAEHIANDTWYFYPVAIIGCIVPWSLYLVAGLGHWVRSLRQKKSSIHLFLLCWVAVTLAIFECAHSKLVSYIFPLFPALAVFLADYVVFNLESKPSKTFYSALWGTALLLICIPAGLFFATIHFSSYVLNTAPVYIFMGVLFVYLLFSVYLLIRRKFAAHIACVSLILPIILFFAFVMHDDFESFASSRNICDALEQAHTVNNVILVSRAYARGVHFYTDKDVAVIDINGSGYFSPHPITFLSSDSMVRDFLDRQNITYAILKKGNVKDVRRIAEIGFSYEVLGVYGDKYLLMITKHAG